MANPIKAIKAVTRAVAGITGKGGKLVNPVYKEMGPTKAQEWEMRHDMRIEQEKISEKQLKEHYAKLKDQWNN